MALDNSGKLKYMRCNVIFLLLIIFTSAVIIIMGYEYKDEPFATFFIGTTSPTTAPPLHAPAKTMVPTEYSTTAPTTQPTVKLTKIPTTQSQSPSTITSQIPTEYTPNPSTENPTLSPTNIPTIYPTITPSLSPTNKLEAFRNVKSENIVIEWIIYAAIIYSIILLFIVFIYFGKNRHEICSRNGTGSLGQTFKATGYFAKIITPILNIVDLVTDFLFSSNILLNYKNNDILSLFGWISLFTGIFGALLFVGKLLLMKKLMFHILRIKKQDLSFDERTREIRKIKSCISCYDLLITAFEDTPQLVIVTLIYKYLGFENTIAVVQFYVTIFSFFWTPFGSVVTVFGCCDENNVIEENDVQNESMNQNDDERGRIIKPINEDSVERTQLAYL
eukprot:42149_1